MLVRRYTLVAFKFVLLRHVQDEGTENKGLMMKHCMICGRWNEGDDKFCTGCGSSLTQSEVSIPQPSGETNVRVCSSCGAVNELSSRFCTACGKPLDADPGTVTRSSDQDAAQTSVMSAFPMSAVPLPSAPAPIAGGATTPSVPAPASPTQPIQIPVLTPPKPSRTDTGLCGSRRSGRYVKYQHGGQESSFRADYRRYCRCHRAGDFRCAGLAIQ